MNRLSKVFLPFIARDKKDVLFKGDLSSKSHRLMLELGLIKPTAQGSFFHLTPMLQKSLEKCTKLIDHYMESIDAQKMTIPILTATGLLKKSGRFETFGDELYTLNDRHGKSFVLSPTLEESITELIATSGNLSYRQYPLRLYQIGNKFRDEQRAKLGLIRAKEFIMKDLYTFDTNREASLRTYEQVNDAYFKLFSTIGVPFLKVEADTGEMGGSLSHEYQYLTDVGDNTLLKCVKCDFGANTEQSGEIDECPKCNNRSLEKIKGIEIGHTFQLDDKYSKAMRANYLQENGKPATLQMGCFGIGVTRIIATAIECLSTETEMRWPFLLAPYSICIIQPKDGSKEQPLVQHYVADIYKQLTQIRQLEHSIMVDDRNQFTIGQRLMEAKKFGYPLIIVVGNKARDPALPIFELHFTHNNSSRNISLTELLSETNEFTKQNTELK